MTQQIPISEGIKQKTAIPVVSNNAVTECIGIVTKANERENLCDVTYINSSGKLDKKQNIEYRVKNKKDEWFPHEQDKVILNESNDNQPIIVNELVDYTKDWKRDRNHNNSNPFSSNCLGYMGMTD